MLAKVNGQGEVGQRPPLKALMPAQAGHGHASLVHTSTSGASERRRTSLAGSMPPAPAIRPRHPGGGAAGVPWPEPEGPALRSNENKGLTGVGGAVILREDEKTHVGAVVLREC